MNLPGDPASWRPIEFGRPGARYAEFMGRARQSLAALATSARAHHNKAGMARCGRLFCYVTSERRDNALMLEKLLIAIMGGLIGGWVGHYMALYRDKRIEFNEAIQPMKDLLVRARLDPRPENRLPDITEIAHVQSLLPKSKQKEYFNAWEQFMESKKAAECRGSSGGVFYEDTTEIKKHTEEVLKYLERR